MLDKGQPAGISWPVCHNHGDIWAHSVVVSVSFLTLFRGTIFFWWNIFTVYHAYLISLLSRDTPHRCSRRILVLFGHNSQSVMIMLLYYVLSLRNLSELYIYVQMSHFNHTVNEWVREIVIKTAIKSFNCITSWIKTRVWSTEQNKKEKRWKENQKVKCVVKLNNKRVFVAPKNSQLLVRHQWNGKCFPLLLVFWPLDLLHLYSCMYSKCVVVHEAAHALRL